MCHDSRVPAGDTVSERGPSLSRPMSGVSRYSRALAGRAGAAGARDRLHRGGRALFASLTLRPGYEMPHKRVPKRASRVTTAVQRALHRKLAFHFYHYHI